MCHLNNVFWLNGTSVTVCTQLTNQPARRSTYHSAKQHYPGKGENRRNDTFLYNSSASIDYQLLIFQRASGVSALARRRRRHLIDICVICHRKCCRPLIKHMCAFAERNGQEVCTSFRWTRCNNAPANRFTTADSFHARNTRWKCFRGQHWGIVVLCVYFLVHFDVVAEISVIEFIFIISEYFCIKFYMFSLNSEVS